MSPSSRSRFSSFPSPDLPLSPSQRRQLSLIESLPFGAYCRLVRAWLWRSGYASVRLCGRGPGRKTYGEGGYDLLSLSHTDLLSVLTLVQLKQGPLPVQRRYVDELRGAMARTGATQGLIVTTGTFSPRACEVAAPFGALGASCDTSAPSHIHFLPTLRLIDGAALLEGLAQSGLDPRDFAEDEAEKRQTSEDDEWHWLEWGAQREAARRRLRMLWRRAARRKRLREQFDEQQFNGQRFGDEA